MSGLHLSLDFWNTLADPNPHFSKKRLELFADTLGIDHKTAYDNYILTKRTTDKFCEEKGTCPSTFEVFRAFTVNCGKDMAGHEIAALSYNLQRLAIENPPAVDYVAFSYLNDLIERGVTINITSNTNFVCGETIRCWLKTWGLKISFGLFSDELRIAKPNPEIFKIVKKFADGKKIVHLGDHLVCDVEGAANAGILSRHAEFKTLFTVLGGFRI